MVNVPARYEWQSTIGSWTPGGPFLKNTMSSGYLMKDCRSIRVNVHYVNEYGTAPPNVQAGFWLRYVPRRANTANHIW